jgi:general stress protein 26
MPEMTVDLLESRIFPQRGGFAMTKSLTQDEKLQKLREIVKAVDICMLTTVDDHGELHSRPMSNNKDVEFDGDLWFFTHAHSLKVDEIGHVSKVNASFADIRGQQYASITGHAELVHDRAKIEELWKPIFRAYFPDGVDSPEIALLKVTVEHAEYWDASQSIFTHAFHFISALVKGEQAQLGENERVDLN